MGKEHTNDQVLTVTLPELVNALAHGLTEPYASGSSYMPSSNRLLLLALALTLRATDILETGYNSGLTSMALAATGAHVVALDNENDQPDMIPIAQERLCHYKNVTVMREDALVFLLAAHAHSFDMIFLDDCHWPLYTHYECLEVRRVLRPGGCVIFHDTAEDSMHLWPTICATLPAPWERLNLPSWQSDTAYSGTSQHQGKDFGIGIVRKPVHDAASYITHSTMNAPEASAWDIELERTMTQAPRMRSIWIDHDHETHIIDNEAHDTLMLQWIGFLTALREQRTPCPEALFGIACYNLRMWGAYCAERASHVMRERRKA